MKIKFIRIIAACLFIAVLSACGQSGKLYLPDQSTAKSQANIGNLEE